MVEVGARVAEGSEGETRGKIDIADDLVLTGYEVVKVYMLVTASVPAVSLNISVLVASKGETNPGNVLCDRRSRLRPVPRVRYMFQSVYSIWRQMQRGRDVCNEQSRE
jgi:spermidine synthase